MVGTAGLAAALAARFGCERRAGALSCAATLMDGLINQYILDSARESHRSGGAWCRVPDGSEFQARLQLHLASLPPKAQGVGLPSLAEGLAEGKITPAHSRAPSRDLKGLMTPEVGKSPILRVASAPPLPPAVALPSAAPEAKAAAEQAAITLVTAVASPPPASAPGIDPDSDSDIGRY